VTLNTAAMFSTGKDDWQTPPEIFDPLNAEFGFTLDVAANKDNAKCGLWLGPGSWLALDALTYRWPKNHTCWMNPPYSRGLQGQFIAKAAEARHRGIETVALLPARTDTRTFHEHIYQREGVEVRFLKGRIKFVGAKHGAPFPSMVVVFRGRA
jgi:phage N-6-adenine-methyltransferase